MKMQKDKTVTIFCKNNNTYKDYPMGTSLLEILKDMKIQSKYKIVSARVNNKMENLDFELYRPKKVEFIDTSISAGMRVYVRSLVMVFYKALQKLFPEVHLYVQHQVSRGYFCKLNNTKHKFTQEDIVNIKAEMNKIIAANLPFIRKEEESEVIIKMFKDCGREDVVSLLETLGENYSDYYELDGTIDYFNGALVPATGYLYLYDIIPYFDGVLLRIPSRKDAEKLGEFIKQDKMFETFEDYAEWTKITKLKNVGDVNLFYKRNPKFINALIRISEARHEKKIIQIADKISAQSEKRVILISGPSSSGKTTLSKRLSIQMMVNGHVPVIMSLDNYFKERVDTPRDEYGEYDYESLYALDLELFNTQIQELLEGKEVTVPTYDFVTGKKSFEKKMKIDKSTSIILEGIHALNPELTASICDSKKFKIYVSALTSISLDDHNWVPTSDVRLLRRIIRDSRSRGYSVQDTISRWESVRRGEEKWIYPYQEDADVMFNSALLFELSALKQQVEPILMKVQKNSNEYSEAHRLLKFLRYLIPIAGEEIPKTSLLREFVGGSGFNY
jgi:uridine kinase